MSAIRARACGETRAATFAESGDRRSLALVGREDASSEIVTFKFLHLDRKSKQKAIFYSPESRKTYSLLVIRPSIDIGDIGGFRLSCDS